MLKPGTSPGTMYGLILDMDGVLVDSARPHFESWKILGEQIGRAVTDEAFLETFGRQNRDIIPLVFGIASRCGISPILIVFAVTIPAGMPFCLPMGSPPNAISYSAGHYNIKEMVRAGIFLNIAAILVLMLIMRFYWPLIGLVF